SVFCFFQAEDGIRGRNVTGVQTCALPIFLISINSPALNPVYIIIRTRSTSSMTLTFSHSISITSFVNGFLELTVLSLGSSTNLRSEERRVGKEGSYRWTRGSCEETRKWVA